MANCLNTREAAVDGRRRVGTAKAIPVGNPLARSVNQRLLDGHKYRWIFDCRTRAGNSHPRSIWCACPWCYASVRTTGTRILCGGERLLTRGGPTAVRLLSSNDVLRFFCRSHPLSRHSLPTPTHSPHRRNPHSFNQPSCESSSSSRFSSTPYSTPPLIFIIVVVVTTIIIIIMQFTAKSTLGLLSALSLLAVSQAAALLPRDVTCAASEQRCLAPTDNTPFCCPQALVRICLVVCLRSALTFPTGLRNPVEFVRPQVGSGGRYHRC